MISKTREISTGAFSSIVYKIDIKSLNSLNYFYLSVAMLSWMFMLNVLYMAYWLFSNIYQSKLFAKYEFVNRQSVRMLIYIYKIYKIYKKYIFLSKFDDTEVPHHPSSSRYQILKDKANNMSF